MGVAQVVSLGLAIVACGWDLKTRRIPQVLTLGGALAGFAFHCAAGGPGAGVGSAVGWVVGIAIFFVPFALGRTRGWRRQAAWRDRRLARSDERGVGRTLRWGRRRSPGDLRRADERLSLSSGRQCRRDVGVLAIERGQAVAGDHARAQPRSAARVCRTDPRRNDGDAVAQMTVASSARSEPRPFDKAQGRPEPVEGRTASREPRRRFWACERGAELVEFAFVFPTLLLVMLGIIDFGFLFQRYEVVTNAAREGARVAILPGYADADVQARVNQYLTRRRLDPDRLPAVGAPQTLPVGSQCITVQAGDGRLPASVSLSGSDCRPDELCRRQRDPDAQDPARHLLDAKRARCRCLSLGFGVRRSHESPLSPSRRARCCGRDGRDRKLCSLSGDPAGPEPGR